MTEPNQSLKPDPESLANAIEMVETAIALGAEVNAPVNSFIFTPRTQDEDFGSGMILDFGFFTSFEAAQAALVEYVLDTWIARAEATQIAGGNQRTGKALEIFKDIDAAVEANASINGQLAAEILEKFGPAYLWEPAEVVKEEIKALYLQRYTNVELLACYYGGQSFGYMIESHAVQPLSDEKYLDARFDKKVQ